MSPLGTQGNGTKQFEAQLCFCKSQCICCGLCHISNSWLLLHAFTQPAALSEPILCSALGNYSQGLAPALRRIYNCEFWQSFTCSSVHAALAMHRDFTIKNAKEGKFIFAFELCIIYKAQIKRLKLLNVISSCVTSSVWSQESGVYI